MTITSEGDFEISPKEIAEEINLFKGKMNHFKTRTKTSIRYAKERERERCKGYRERE